MPSGLRNRVICQIARVSVVVAVILWFLGGCRTRTLEINPQDAAVWSDKGAALDDQGRVEEALKCYDRALEINPREADAWGNKGRFAAWFKYYVRPFHYEFARVYFHKREQFCIPQIDVCSASPGYPTQNYNSALPACPVSSGTYGSGVPTGSQDGPITG